MSLHHWMTQTMALGIHHLVKKTYDIQVSWVEPPPPDAWQDIRLYAFLNHTSLAEPLFLGTMPPQFLKDASRRTLVPGADITMSRPIAGRFFKLFSPNTVSISRKRDGTWEHFLDQIQENSLVALAAEGRMMRENGLDKHGKPMSVRGGVADIMLKIQRGKMLIGYSGGLHHINKPGEPRIRLFQPLKICYELARIEDFLERFDSDSPQKFRLQVARELEERLQKYKPE